MDLMNKKTFRKLVLNLVGVGILACLLSFLDDNDMSSLSFFSSTEKEIDFQSSDFYNMVADSRAECVLDDRVVIVPIDDCDRIAIRQLIEDVALCQPAAIGLDVFFQFPMEGDSLLLQTLRNTPNIVLSRGIDYDEGNEGSVMPAYLLDSLPESQRGVVNLNVFHRYNVVRSFKPYYKTEGGSVPNFSVQLAKAAGRADVENTMREHVQDSDDVIINYTSREFDVISPSQVLARVEDINGKIVLMGALEEMQDTYRTPVEEVMPGVMIHAYALSTILQDNYQTTMPKWGMNVLSILLCVVFVLVKIWLDNYRANDLLMRIFQIVVILLLIYLGSYLFVKHNFILELSQPLLIVALGLFALDVWKGVLALFDMDV